MSDEMDYNEVAVPDYLGARRNYGRFRRPSRLGSSFSSMIVLNQVKNLEADLREVTDFRKGMAKVKDNKRQRDILKTLMNSIENEIVWRREWLGLEIADGNYP
jgi:hypothetical protein